MEREKQFNRNERYKQITVETKNSRNSRKSKTDEAVKKVELKVLGSRFCRKNRFSLFKSSHSLKKNCVEVEDLLYMRDAIINLSVYYTSSAKSELLSSEGFLEENKLT